MIHGFLIASMPNMIQLLPVHGGPLCRSQCGDQSRVVIIHVWMDQLSLRSITTDGQCREIPGFLCIWDFSQYSISECRGVENLSSNKIGTGLLHNSFLFSSCPCNTGHGSSGKNWSRFGRHLSGLLQGRFRKYLYIHILPYKIAIYI